MFPASIHCLTASEGEVDVATSLRMYSHIHAKQTYGTVNVRVCILVGIVFLAVP